MEEVRQDEVATETAGTDGDNVAHLEGTSAVENEDQTAREGLSKEDLEELQDTSDIDLEELEDTFEVTPKGMAELGEMPTEDEKLEEKHLSDHITHNAPAMESAAPEDEPSVDEFEDLDEDEVDPLEGRRAQLAIGLDEEPPEDLFNVILIGRDASLTVGCTVGLKWTEESEDGVEHVGQYARVVAVRFGPFNEVIQRHAGLNCVSAEPDTLRAYYEGLHGGPLKHDPGCTVIYLVTED